MQPLKSTDRGKEMVLGVSEWKEGRNCFKCKRKWLSLRLSFMIRLEIVKLLFMIFINRWKHSVLNKRIISAIMPKSN